MSNNSLGVKKGATTERDPETAAQALYDAIYQPDTRFALFYCSPEYDLNGLAAALKSRFGDTPLIGCTTAGEITPIGYLNGALTGVSIASKDVRVAEVRTEKFQEFELEQGQAVAAAAINDLRERGITPRPDNSFAFLLIDGMSMKEEPFVSAVHRNLHGVQLFGGSAGDGTDFGATYIYHEGEFHTDCAVLAVVHTEHPFHVFKTQHFESSTDKMVVTEADPARRIVTEINGEPAGREYARMVGLEVDKLTPMIFAAHPVVVKVGGAYYIRSIQKVNDDGSLSFFCAIDEGIVLTVAQGIDMVENLRELFSEVRTRVGEPELVLGCDCILRNLELDQRGIREQVGDILKDNNVIGFATYGEQFNAMHVNQTFTGVAIGSLPDGGH